MKRLLVILALLTGAAWGQGANGIVLSFPGAPTGTCAAFVMMAVNASNGDFYSCAGNAWVKVTGTQTGAVNAVYGSTGTITTLANPVFTGTLSAAAGTFSTTLGVTGTTTLGVTNTGALTSTTGTFTGNLTTNVSGTTQCLHVDASGVVSGTGSDCGSVSSTAFSVLSSATNTTAAMVVGAGASLVPTSTGQISNSSTYLAPVAQTAPAGATSVCPSSSFSVLGWIQKSDSSWQSLYGEDTSDVTSSLGTPFGVNYWCNRWIFSDSGQNLASQTQQGAGPIRTTLISIGHKSGILFTPSSSLDDRALTVRSTDTDAVAADYHQWLGIYGEHFVYNNAFTCAPIGGSDLTGEDCVAGIRYRANDQRTTGTNNITRIVGGHFIGSTNVAAPKIGSCTYCVFGVIGSAVQQSVGSQNGNGAVYVGVAGTLNASASNTAGSGIGLFANTPGTRFASGNTGLYVASYGNNSSDYNIRSKSSGTLGDGRNYFEGQTIMDQVLDIKETAAPANPGAGYDRLYMDSITHVLTCLTSAGANCLAGGGGSGTVTSVAATVPSGITVSGSPITTSGTLAFSWSVAGADSVILSSAANTADFAAVPSCSTGSSALTYNTSTHAFGCNTISGSGTVNGGTGAQLAWYATTGSAVSGNANATISTGALTLGQSGTAGSLILNGATSGTATISATATGGTLVLPATQLSTITGVAANCLHADTNGNVTGTGSDCGSGGSTALSALTAAAGSNSISNGDNPQVWQWLTTTADQIGMRFQGLGATSTGTPYLVQIDTATGSTATPLAVKNSLNGSQTLPALAILPTWNTTGVVDAALFINATNTASGAASKLIDAGTGGGSFISQWSVDKGGVVTQTGQLILPAGSTSSDSVVFGSSNPGLFAASAAILGLQFNATSGDLRFYNGSTVYTILTGSNSATTLNASAAATLLALRSNYTNQAASNGMLQFFNNGSISNTGGGNQEFLVIGANGGANQSFAPASGATSYVLADLRSTINQTGTSSGNYTMLKIAATETACGSASCASKSQANKLLDLFAGSSGTTEMFAVAANGNIITAGTNSVASTVSVSASTTASVTFTNAYVATPVCVLTPQTSGLTSWYLSAISNTGFTVTVAPSGSYTFGYLCMGAPN